MNNIVLSLLLGLAVLGSVGTYLLHKQQDSKLSFNLEDYGITDLPELELRSQLFQSWMNTYNKRYSKPEAFVRFAIWNQNYDIVQEHNAKNLSWTLETNQFADLNTEEFSALYLGFRPSLQAIDNVEILDESDTPNDIDWRNKGAVTDVKNQGGCGACYAFASAVSLEGLRYNKQQKLESLSAAQIRDCSGSYGNQGCNGGSMTASFDYTKASGLRTWASYPYSGSQGSCKGASGSVVKNRAYTNVQQSSSQLKSAVNRLPVAVGIEASGSAFQMYKTGTISSGCGNKLDHAITIVGYSGDHWIVKNSWGAAWGINGYVQIALGDQLSGAGICGINSAATYPT